LATRLGHEGWVWVDFQPTVTMSTYLVAFAVHDFGSVSTVSEDGEVIFRVSATAMILRRYSYLVSFILFQTIIVAKIFSCLEPSNFFCLNIKPFEQ
jgi:hypothetical protein